MRQHSFLFTTALSLLVVFHSGAQGTSFTYQGRLNDGGVPANGTYDLVFAIYASANGVNDGFANRTNSATSVSNGLFTVNLNLGLPGIFTGEERWLEIEVRKNGPGPYARLSPRQKITATPYAITASNLSGTISASQLSGAIPLAQLPAAVVTNNQSGVNFTGTFAGNGGSLSNLTSEKLTGTLTVSLGTPVSLGNLSDGGYAHGVSVSGNYAYLANLNDGLRVYNIVNPTNPVSIGHINDGGFAWRVAVSGNYAYLANDDDGLRVYNIANPTNPVSVGHINDGSLARDVAVSGNFAYLANRDDGLRIYNVANPTNPVGIGHINNGGLAFGVAVSGNYAYLANYDDGLRIYSIANPTNPVSISHINDGGAAWAVAVSGNFGYLANMGDGLRIYSIANPTNPVSIGHINDGGSALGVAVSGNFAYLADSGDGLRVYNITNPTNPVSIGHSYDGGSAEAVAASGDFAYIANSDDGLRVYGMRAASALAFQGNGSLLTGLNADNITSGTLNAARIPNLDASKITSGTIADARLSANVALRSGGNTFTGDQTITSGNVGIGTPNPTSGNGALGTVLNVNSAGNANTVAVLGSGATSASSLGAIFEGRSNLPVTGDARLGQLGFLRTTDVTAGRISGYANLYVNNNGTLTEALRVTPAGNVGVGVSAPQQQLSVGAGLNIDQNNGNSGTVGNALTFGSSSGEGIASKRTAGGNQFGLDFYTASINRLSIANSGNITADGNMAIAAPGTLSFGSSTRQMLNLWSTEYGIGVQASAAYFRTDQEFMWYRGGSHSDTFGDPGAGGTQIMRLGNSGSLIIAGTLSQGSDRNIKQDFAAVNAQEVLKKVVALPIQTWTYTNDPGCRHVGPIAQDFHAAFGLNGNDDKHIATVDESGVALAAIQGLNQKIVEKDREIRVLKQRLERLERFFQKGVSDVAQ